MHMQHECLQHLMTRCMALSAQSTLPDIPARFCCLPSALLAFSVCAAVIASPTSCSHHLVCPVATMEVQLPKDYICKCQCAVRLQVTYPAEACSVQGPYPMVIFSSGFQVRHTLQ
jgi:hypothetical protein